MLTEIKPFVIDESLSKSAINWRHDLHQIPEQGFNLYKTQQYLINLLEDWGVEYETGYGKTGLVVTIHGQNSGNTIAFRCDIDALEIEDDSGKDWHSIHEGYAHACGHDGHMAITLAAIKALSEGNNFNGSVKFLFQPSEENGKGAKAMMEDGLFKAHRYSELYGFHNMPRLEDKTVQLRYGATTGAGECFTLSVTGKSGHSSVPEKCINPISVAGEIIGLWNEITSNIENDMAVIAICKCNSGTTFNGIPEQAELGGTMRYFEAHIADYMRDEMQSLAQKVCQKYGATYTLNFEILCPATVNTIEHSDSVIQCAQSIYGADHVITDVAASPGGEDMQFLVTDEVEGVCWFMIGTKGTNLHTSTFDFDDSSLSDAASLLVNIVRKRLSN